MLINRKSPFFSLLKRRTSRPTRSGVFHLRSSFTNMSTPAQLTANQANAQHSTGPKSEQGKATSCQNNFRHGLTGMFSVLPSEDQSQYDALLEGLRQEHQPSTLTEHLLVEKMAQHFWLSQRAQKLADLSMDPDLPNIDHDEAALSQRAEDSRKEKQFALFLRYQATNDRDFHKCLDQLLKLRAERRKAEIGFESQKRKETEEVRKQAAETRKQELHSWRVLLAEAEAEHRLLLNHQLETAPKTLKLAS
jgi:hypothetical protein